MDDCCNAKGKELDGLAAKQRVVLFIALFINAIMFLVEGGYGLVAGSTSLLADSLDMLGDAFIYGFSLFVIGKSARWHAWVSAVKGALMAAFGVSVIVEATRRFLAPGLPIAETMGWVAGLALIANVTCAILLLRHRNDDINLRSTWLCTRNDMIANIGVLLAAGAVAMTQSRYPDLAVGVIIAGLVLYSSVRVLKESIHALGQKPA